MSTLRPPPALLVQAKDPPLPGETLGLRTRASRSASAPKSIATATVIAAAAQPVESTTSDGAANVDDTLTAVIGPPQIISEENLGFGPRCASSGPSTRFDVLTFQKALDAKLVERQARDRGICPVREELFSQAFEALMYEVAVTCPARGALLLRVRNALQRTTETYKTVVDSSVIFGRRQQVEAEEGLKDLRDQIGTLQHEKEEDERRVAELTYKLEVLEQRVAERKALQDKKFTEELDFLQHQGHDLNAFLKSARAGS